MGYLDAIKHALNVRNDVLLGFIDYKYMPFALGDTFTWLTNLHIMAKRRGLQKITLLILADARWRVYRLQPHVFPLQPRITVHDYRDVLSNLSPAYLCLPMVDAIHVLEQRHAYAAMLMTAALGGKPMWPGVSAQFLQKIDYSTHTRINAYFKETGDVPQLSAPRGYVRQAAEFRCRHLDGRFVVAVNIRQRATQMDMADVQRDSPMSVWMSFFDRIQRLHPDVVFLILGGQTEWDRSLFMGRNIVIPRTFGHSLGMDLALLFDSDLFIGTSSGFSAAATFSDVPYIITHFDPVAAKLVDVSVGTPRYPFAGPCQTLSWQVETCDLLTAYFEDAYAFLTSKAGAGFRAEGRAERRTGSVAGRGVNSCREGRAT